MNIPPPSGRYPQELISEMETETDNVRRELKNSFFSLIKEKMRKNEYTAIPDDHKLFLYEMRKHHESIAEQEKILKQKSLLDSALAEKITLLELLEEGWYLLRKEIETKQILLIEKEKLIDEMTADLKSLMHKSGSFDKNFQNINIEKQKTILPEEKWFTLKNGKKLSTINDLKESLKYVDDDIFHHHVTSQKNDFSSWIRHVFMDAKLADKIMSAKSKNELVSILENWKEN